MKQFNELQVGTWYIPVFDRIEPLDTYGNINDTHRTDSPLYEYLGGREFADENGEPVDRFYDPELGFYVAVDAPDGFIG